MEKPSTSGACKERLRSLQLHPFNRLAPHAEHIGFIAYAGSETFAIHGAIWFVAAYLFATGLWGLLTIEAVQDWLGA